MSEGKEPEKEVKKEAKKEKVELKNLSFQERLTKALGELPDKLPTAEGQIGNRKYNYTPLPVIMSAVRPIFSKYGLAVVQDCGSVIKEDGHYYIRVMTKIVGEREGEEVVSSWLESRIIKTSSGNVLQSMGATLTYLKRYSLGTFLGLATDEDTDAQIDIPVQKPYKENKKKYEKSDVPRELRDKINGLWQKVKEARDLGILSDEVALRQREALKKISTNAGIEAYEKALMRLIETERDKRAKELEGKKGKKEIIEDVKSGQDDIEPNLIDNLDEGVDQWMN